MLDDARYLVTENGRDVRLTKSEFKILRLLLWVNGRVISWQKLQEKGCGWTTGAPATNTVRQHAVNLRAKLSTCRQHLTTVTGVGLRFDGPIRYEEEYDHARVDRKLRLLTAIGLDQFGFCGSAAHVGPSHDGR